MAEKEIKTKEAAKTPKAKKEKKKGKIGEAWRGFKSECKKIVWPTWKQVLKNSGIVLVIIAVSMIAIGALDFVFRHGFDALMNLTTH